jgi:S1-C subfamily serine protease
MTEEQAEKYIETTKKFIANRPSVPPAYKPKEVRKEKGFSSGTGFFITNDGYLITSFHVVEDATQILIKNTQGEEYIAKYVRGDEVFTLGYPLIQIQGQEQKATFGRICALSGIQDDIRFLQIDVPIQPGNSGGPLINRNGLVIGITTATLSQLNVLRESGSLPQSVNYAVKSDYIIPVIRDYAKDLNDKIDDSKRDYDFRDLIKKTEPSVVLVFAK